MISLNVNVWALLVSALVSLMFGAVWYSKFIFGKIWMKLMDLKQEEEQEGMMLSLVGNFLSLLLTGFILANLFDLIGFQNMKESLIFTFWLWLGFVAMYSLNSVWWEKKKIQLYFINISGTLIGLLLMAAVLFTWA